MAEDRCPRGERQLGCCGHFMLSLHGHFMVSRTVEREGQALAACDRPEGVISNVRKTIIREQLTDPHCYEQMLLLLGDLIRQNQADAAAYEEFLRKAEAPG